MKKIFTVILLIVIFLLIFVPEFKALLLRGASESGVFNAKTDNVVSTDVTLYSHPFRYTDSNGKTYDSTDHLKGKVVFMNFWASWCAPCIAEFPGIQELYNHYKGDNEVVFITFSLDDELQTGLNFLDKKGYTLPVFSLENAPSANWYNGSLPTTLVLDKNGKVVYKKENIAHYNTDSFKAFLNGLKVPH